MSELSPVPSLRPENMPVRHIAATDENFEQREAGTGGVTPLQVALSRKWQIIAFAIIVSAIVGVIIKQVTPIYTAVATVLYDPRQPRVSSGENLLPTQTIDGDLVRTRIEAFRAPSIARAVVQQLGLTTAPEFCQQPLTWSETLHGLMDKVAGRAGDTPAPTAACETSIEQAADRLMGRVGFSSDGRSYYISVSAEASTPELATQIANAYVATFVDQQRKKQVGLTDEADVWLANHIGELRADVTAADGAVAKQRQSAQLTSVHGETVLSQSLSELNSQLSLASSELAQKKGTLAGLEGYARSGGGALDASAPILASPIIQKLLEREGTLAGNQAELGTRLGSANSEVIANGAQLDRTRQQLRTEVNKAVVALRGEVQALEARRGGLAASVRDLQTQAGGQGLASMRLQDLERDAASARSRYDVAATRLEQIRIEAATQRADVQPLVEAVPPKVPSYPRTRMIVTGTFMASLGVGTAIALVLALMSRVFDDPAQVEELTGTRVLGLFPSPVRRRAKPQDTVVEDPTSREAETLQAVLSSLIGNRFRRDARLGWTLMVTSAVPGEGKSSFSVALGRAAVGRGLSVVVVDFDLRRSTMRGLFSTLEKPGQANVDDGGTGSTISSNGYFGELAVDPLSGLHVLMAPPLPRNPHALLSSASLPRALEKLRGTYDVVIIDTPPMLAVPDALELASLVDDVVMLMEWGRSSRNLLLAAFKTLRRAHIPVSGIVLSKVNLRQFARKVGGDNYYAVAYPAYHTASRR